MRKKLFKGVLLFLCCAIAAAAIPAYAAPGDFIGLTPNGNLFARMERMLPGSSETEYIYIQNLSSENSTFYLEAKTADLDVFNSLLEKNQSDRLLQQLTLTLVYHTVNDNLTINPVGTMLFQGRADGSQPNGTQAILDNRITIGDIRAGKSAVIVATLSVSEDIGNEYDNMQGKFIWVFSVIGLDNTVTPPDSGGGRDRDRDSGRITILDADPIPGDLPQIDVLTDNPPGTTPPDTVDSRNPVLSLSLLVLSAVTMAGMSVLSKHRSLKHVKPDTIHSK